ncbi:MAG: protein kinase [Deltaproteobacteria bacterium]|nr:protein kinase [Deltaproteobacteria bacterium]
MWVLAVVVVTIGIAVVLGLRARATRRCASPPAVEPEAIPVPVPPSSERSSPIAELAERAVPTIIKDDPVIDGRYLRIGKLGSDELGPAFEVERLADGKRFALKTLRRRGADRMNRFAREARLAAEIDHPNLVPVLDMGFTANDFFIVMPLVHGGSLEQLRGRFGDPAWALPLLVQIASGLVALHARGIVHRALRPSNVLISRGTARLTDVGLAILSRRADEAHTDDATVDIRAFGELAREMLGGDVPTWLTRCLDADPAARPTAPELITLIGS